MAPVRAAQVPEGPCTAETLRNNIAVCIRYMAAWIGGTGCVPLYNLMEDAATAEISRAQVRQGLAAALKGQVALPVACQHSDMTSMACPAPCQVWQWVQYSATLDGGTVCTAGMVRRVIEEECAAIRAELGNADAYAAGVPASAFRKGTRQRVAAAHAGQPAQLSHNSLLPLPLPFAPLRRVPGRRLPYKADVRGARAARLPHAARAGGRHCMLLQGRAFD